MLAVRNCLEIVSSGVMQRLLPLADNIPAWGGVGDAQRIGLRKDVAGDAYWSSTVSLSFEAHYPENITGSSR